MPNVFAIEGTIAWVIELILLAVKIYALVNSVLWSDQHYRAAGKLNKATWVIILAVGVAVQALLAGSPISILNLVFTIAAFVYLADVRPAMAGLRRR